MLKKEYIPYIKSNKNPKYKGLACMDISVVIPTYNGKKRIHNVLNALKKQKKAENISWEIIVVDNASDDHIRDIAEKYRLDFEQLKIHFKLLREERSGALFARMLGAKHAKAGIIGFLDDDNIPENNWINEAFGFLKQHPKASAVGSFISCVCEENPPKGFNQIKGYYSAKNNNEIIQYAMNSNLMPPTAGLVVRRMLWLNLEGQQLLTGRTANSFITGEDIEGLLIIQKSGGQIWHNPRMRIKHKIQTERFEERHVKFFFRGIGLSRCTTRMVKIKPYLKCIFIAAYFCKDMADLFLFLIGQRKMTPYVRRAKFHYYLGCLASPYIYIKLLIVKYTG